MFAGTFIMTGLQQDRDGDEALRQLNENDGI